MAHKVVYRDRSVKAVAGGRGNWKLLVSGVEFRQFDSRSNCCKMDEVVVEFDRVGMMMTVVDQTEDMTTVDIVAVA